MHYTLVEFAGRNSITVLIDGEMLSAADSHPAYDEIVERVKAGDESVADLFNLAEAVKKAFGAVTDRVTVEQDAVYLDGEPVRGRIGDSLISLVTEEGVAGATGLAKFLEKLSNNPSHRSREQLFQFVEHNGITIDGEGNLMLHKGVQGDGEGGYQSWHAGTAFVNDEKIVGHIPARVGDVISMPRSEVSDDPNVQCHVGLHASTRDYAGSYANAGGAMLTMRVDPADVVSVPHGAGSEKLRVCRYEVVEVNTRDFTSAYWRSESEDVLEDDLYDDEDEDGYEFVDEDDEEVTPWSGAGGFMTADEDEDDDEANEPDPRNRWGFHPRWW